MSDCKRPLEYLLEADPEQLQGRGDGEVSRHMRECERCAAAASKVLESMASLDAALSTAPAGLDVDALLRRANASESKHKTATVTPMRRRWQRIATAALAASIVGLVVLSDRDDALPGAPYAPRSALQVPIVEAPAGQNVAVIATDNPDITVLWFYK